MVNIVLAWKARCLKVCWAAKDVEKTSRTGRAWLSAKYGREPLSTRKSMLVGSQAR